jgi:hypothetical protein
MGWQSFSWLLKNRRKDIQTFLNELFLNTLSDEHKGGYLFSLLIKSKINIKWTYTRLWKKPERQEK